MADTKILFSKTTPLDQLTGNSSMMDHLASTSGLEVAEKPPTYEESAKDLTVCASSGNGNGNFDITCPPTTSIDANGSISISMDKLPTSGPSPAVSVSALGSSVSVDQMVEEVTALQRAYIHLYKRVHHFKSQMWYAALAFITLFLGFLLFFLAYHPQHSSPVAVVGSGSGLRSEPAFASHRTGKALVGGSSSLDVVSSNGLDGDHHDDTELLLKHLSRIATTTISAGTSSKLATSEILSLSGKSSDNLDNTLNTAESVQDEQTVKVMAPFSPSSPSTTSSTTTIMSTTTTEVSETEQSTDEETKTTESHAQLNPQPNPSQQNPSKPNPSQSSSKNPPDTYNISIVVHSATVPNMDYLPLGRASDTYCDVFIDDVLVGSTPIIDNNNSPNWQYLLPKSYRVRAESTIRVDLLDRDHLKKDHIGGVVMLVGDLVNTNRLDRPVKFFHGRGDVWVTVKLV